MAKRLNSFEKQCLQELAVAASNAARLRGGESVTSITSGTGASGGRTVSRIANSSALNATELLTEREVSRLYVIKREVGRKYAVTMQDLQFLVEIIERCGL